VSGWAVWIGEAIDLEERAAVVPELDSEQFVGCVPQAADAEDAPLRKGKELVAFDEKFIK
jgi:hypothetical protein